MVSAIGFKLNSPDMITGFGYRRHRIHRARGDGVGRKVVGAVVRKIGHALTDRLASAISGNGSYRLTGGRFAKGVKLDAAHAAQLFKSGIATHTIHQIYKPPPRKYTRLTAAQKEENRLKREAKRANKKVKEFQSISSVTGVGLYRPRRRRAHRSLTGGRKLVHRRYF